jgi:hypothetical protein
MIGSAQVGLQIVGEITGITVQLKLVVTRPMTRSRLLLPLVLRPPRFTCTMAVKVVWAGFVSQSTVVLAVLTIMVLQSAEVVGIVKVIILEAAAVSVPKMHVKCVPQTKRR